MPLVAIYMDQRDEKIKEGEVKMKGTMKKVISVILALALVVTSVTVYNEKSVKAAAPNWSTIAYAGDGAEGGALANKYKFYSQKGSLANIQKPEFSKDSQGNVVASFYVTFPAGISECSLGDGNYNIQGAGIALHISAFTQKVTEFTVTYAGGEDTCYVYYEDGVEGETTTPAPTETTTSEGKPENAPAYGSISVEDTDWAKIEKGETFTHGDIGTPADGSTWEMAKSYYAAVKDSAYIQFANSGADLSYGGKNNNTITGPAFAFSAKDNAHIASVWINATKLEVGTDYCRNIKNGDGTYKGDVVCLAQSLFTVGAITYVTVRYNDGTDKIVPVRVTAAEETTIEETTTPSGTTDDSPYAGLTGWVPLENDNHVTTDIYKGAECVMTTDSSATIQVHIYRDANNAYFAFDNVAGPIKTAVLNGVDISSSIGNTGVTITNFSQHFTYTYNVLKITDANGKTSTLIIRLPNNAGKGTYTENVPETTTPAETTTPGTTTELPVDPIEAPADAAWIDIGSNETGKYSIYVPDKDAARYIPTRRVDTDYVMLGFGVLGAPFSSLKLNGVDIEKTNNANVYIQESYMNGYGVYKLDVVAANGTDTISVYVKREAVRNYKPVGLKATVSPRGVATITWTESADAKTDGNITYKVTVNGTEVTDITGTTATYTLSEYGNYDIVVTAYKGEEAVGSSTCSVSYKDPDAVTSVLTVKELWESCRWEVLSWDAVETATGYAIYVDGKLFSTTTVTTYNLPAYAFANKTNINGQPTTVGTHNVKVVALYNAAKAPTTYDASSQRAATIGSDYATLYVNYVYGNETTLWNNTGKDSSWNFTICESADDPNINVGADVAVTYNSDGSADLIFNNMGEHAKNDQEWTIKAAVYNEAVSESGLINLSFAIDGPAELVGSKITIKCVSEEWANGSYTGSDAIYEEKAYTFEPVYAEDGKTVIGSVIQYSNTFESKNSTYDLLFGLGELNFKDAKSLTLSDPTEVQVYGLKTLTPSGINNTDSEKNNSIYVAWTSNVPERLKADYTYNVYIDGTLVEKGATSGTIYGTSEAGYTLGDHTVKVESIYNGTVTSTLTETVTIKAVTMPDLVISDISIATDDPTTFEGFVGDTVTFNITMKNIGNANAVVSGTNNMTVELYANGNRIHYYTLEDDEDAEGNQILAPGASVTKTIDYKVDENLVDAKHNNYYTIKAVADADNYAAGGRVTESNESNNEYEKVFVFHDTPKELGLANDGSKVTASWTAPEEAVLQYAIRYTVDGADTYAMIDADTTAYDFPVGQEPDNNTMVKVYAKNEDGSMYQIARKTALADLELVSAKVKNDVAYVGEATDVIVTVKNVGVAKAQRSDDNANNALFPVKTRYNGTTMGHYAFYEGEVLAPNGEANITIPGGVAAAQVTASGIYTLEANVDDASEGNGVIKESDDNDTVDTTRNNFKTIDFTAISKGTLTLNAPTAENAKVSATWTDPNTGALTPEAYKITYTTNGETKTVEITDFASMSYNFDDLIDNNTKVTVAAKYAGVTEYLELAEATALADLVIETITVAGNTYINKPFDVIVTIKNQGTANIPASSEEFVEGDGRWIIVSMEQNDNFNNSTLMQSHTAAGLAAGATSEITITGVTGTVLTEEDLTFKVDSPGVALEEGTGYITESDETNNTKDLHVNITEKPFEQIREMDWTPLYDKADAKQKYQFKVASGTYDCYIEYKVLDTSYTDIHFEDIFSQYSGYASTWMYMGIDEEHELISVTKVEGKTATSQTVVNFAQVTSSFCNNYNAEVIPNYKPLANRGCDIVNAEGNVLYPTTADTPINYDGNGFQFFVNAFAPGKYYVAKINNGDEFVTVAFRVTDDNGAWIQAKASDGTDVDNLPFCYHEENAAYPTNGGFYYDGSDLGLAVISAYNGDHLAITTDTSKPLDYDNYKIELAYASVDNTGNFVVPTEGFVTVTEGLGRDGMNTIQAKLPELIKQLPIHSKNGGMRDEQYYFMKIYPNADEDYYVSVPIRIHADIPMIENVADLKANIIREKDDSSALSVTWTETTNQAVYDYHYDLFVYKSKYDYNNGTDPIVTVTDASPQQAYVYSTATVGTTPYVKLVTKWCDQKISKAVTAVEVYNPGWREISGSSSIDVHAGATEKVAIVGKVSFYDAAKENHAYDVVGYNGMYINISGNASYYGQDVDEEGKPIDGDPISVVTISEGVSNVNELSSVSKYREVNSYEQTKGQIKINTQNVFQVSYKTTYYNLKVVKGTNETIIKVKVEVTPGDVEVNAFQMNTDTSEGAVSEFSPSFRTVSRASKIVATGDTFSFKDESGQTVENVAIASVKSYGTLYTVNGGTEDGMVFSAGYVSNGEIAKGSGIYAFEATKAVGTLTNWPGASDKDSIYYALTFKAVNYSLEILDKNYTVRAYAVTENGDIVYGKNVPTTSIYDIARVLYDESRMTSEERHNYLYDNVLNIVSIKNNRKDISYAMMKALKVSQTKDPNYTLINNTYNELRAYITLTGKYKNVKYYERGEYDTDSGLKKALNTASGTTYSTVGQWIENKVSEQDCHRQNDTYKGFYARVAYSPAALVTNE